MSVEKSPASLGHEFQGKTLLDSTSLACSPDPGPHHNFHEPKALLLLYCKDPDAGED